MYLNNEILVPRIEMVIDSNPGISRDRAYEIAFNGIVLDLIAGIIIKTEHEDSFYK